MWALFRRGAIAAVALAAVMIPAFAQASKTPKPRVLILGPSVTGGTSSWEAKEAKADGFAVTIVSGKQWDKLTTAQFKHYRALIIGDNTDSGNSADVQAAVNNASTWGHAINANIIVSGADPEYHASHGVAGAVTYIARAIAFAGKVRNHTGFYFAGGGYYGGSSPQHVAVLDGLKPGGFYWQDESVNPIHIDPAVKPHPTGLSDASMSNWGQTMHRAFTTWPKSFQVWAVGVSSSGNWTTSDNVKGWAGWLVSTRFHH